MYKVFIQNRPLFFISIDEVSDFNAIFVPISIVNEARSEFEKMIENNAFNCSICILTDDIEKDMNLFFESYTFVEAAGGLVVKDSEILFIKRNGIWDLPKGMLETGESPEVAAVREVEEECGIQNPILGDLISITYHCYEFEGKPTLKKTNWYHMTYSGDDKLIPQTKEGITKVKWKSRKKTLKLLDKTYGSIKDVLSTFLSKEESDETCFLQE